MYDEGTITMRTSAFAFAIFCLYVLVPSFEQFQKYTGNAGIVAYFVLGIGLLYVLRNYVLDSVINALTPKTFWIFSIAAFLLVCVLFIFIYPYANTGFVFHGRTIGGRGDRDDAINIAVRAMLRGSYPYYEKTPNGNPITPMPGALLFGTPFVILLGNSAYQNLFWLPIFFLVLAKFVFKSVPQTFLLLTTIFLCSPIVLQEIVTGGDYLSNTIYILVLSILFIHYLAEQKSLRIIKIGISIVLGIAFSSRAIFLLIVPVLYTYLVNRVGVRETVKYLTYVLLVFAAVTFPFYFADPAGFTPLTAYSYIGKFGETIPYIGPIVTILSGCIALGVALWKIPRDEMDFLRRCALTLIFPIVGTIVVVMISNGNLSLKYYGAYPLAFMLFGAVGYWGDFARSQINPKI